MSNFKPNQKAALDEQRPAREVFFEEHVNNIVEALRRTLLNTYERRNVGAFTFGTEGLLAVASEQLTLANSPMQLFNAATFVLAAALLSMGSFDARRAPPAPEKASPSQEAEDLRSHDQPAVEQRVC